MPSINVSRLFEENQTQDMTDRIDCCCCCCCCVVSLCCCCCCCCKLFCLVLPSVGYFPLFLCRHFHLLSAIFWMIRSNQQRPGHKSMASNIINVASLSSQLDDSRKKKKKDRRTEGFDIDCARRIFSLSPATLGSVRPHASCIDKRSALRSPLSLSARPD